MSTDSSERLKKLSPAKRALLLKLMREEAATAEKARVIPRRAQRDAAPLSFAQQRLWFLHQFEPDTTAYNIPLTVRLTGPLDLPAVEKTLTEIISRHEILRTTFVYASDGQLIQVVSPALQLSLPFVDLSSLPEAEREAEAQRRAVEDLHSPFDLAQGPLLRVALLRLGEEDHVVLFTMHHIISDGWSTSILAREVATLYQAFTSDQPSPLPELAIQYADYAVWQREWLQGDVLQQQLDYWRKQLEGAPSVIELPTDHPRPAVQTFRGARHRFLIDERVSTELRQLSQREGVTLFMTLLAAFQTLLARYSGQDDIVIGTPIAGRTRAEVEPLIGFFVNTLVLRSDLTGDPTFRDALRHVREVCLGAYAHQDLPFEKLVEELQPQRDLSRSPL
ncbi:MAG: condensation domain-containing protein, partial [Pyrinomonadaceae bacterium]